MASLRQRTGSEAPDGAAHEETSRNDFVFLIPGWEVQVCIVAKGNSAQFAGFGIDHGVSEKPRISRCNSNHDSAIRPDCIRSQQAGHAKFTVYRVYRLCRAPGYRHSFQLTTVFSQKLNNETLMRRIECDGIAWSKIARLTAG